jgi:hypothetical protein
MDGAREKEHLLALKGVCYRFAIVFILFSLMSAVDHLLKCLG